MDDFERLLRRLTQLSFRIPFHIKSASLGVGEHKAIRVSRGREIVDSGPFRFGVDSASDYHPRLSARLGKPMRKITNEERELTVMCLIDQRYSMFMGSDVCKRDFALEVAGAIGLTAIKHSDRFYTSITLADEPIRRSRGTNNKNRMISNIATLQKYGRQNYSSDLCQSLESAASMLTQRSIVYIISDFLFSPSPDEKKLALNKQTIYKNTENSLEILANRRDVGLIAINDPMDFKLPKRGLRLQSPESNMPCTIQGGDKSTSDILTDIRHERYEWLDNMRYNLGIKSCELETEEDSYKYLTPLMEFLLI